MNGFDNIYTHVGDFGKFQWILLLILGWIGIPSNFNILLTNFILATPQHHCNVDYDVSLLPNASKAETRCPSLTIPDACDEFSNPTDPSSELVKCQNDSSKYYYDEEKRWWHTAVVDYDLVCEDSTIIALMQSGLQLGYALK